MGAHPHRALNRQKRRFPARPVGRGPRRNAAARMEQNGAMEVALQADGSHGANMWPVRKPHYYS